MRKRIITDGRKCEKCRQRLATDPHHLRYGNIYDIHMDDLAALCRPCHDVVESAKRVGILGAEHSRQEMMEVSQEMLDKRAKRKSKRTSLPEWLMKRVENGSHGRKRFVAGIMGIPQPSCFLDWVGIITTQSKIDHIVWALNHYAPEKRDRKSWMRGPARKKVGVHY